MPSESSSPKAAPKKSRWQTFKDRGVATLILWALIGSALVSTQPVFYYLLIGGFMLLGLYEFFHILHIRNTKIETVVTISLALAYFSSCFWKGVQTGSNDFKLYDSVFLCAVVFAGFVIHLFFAIKVGRSHFAVMSCVFGFVYIAFLFNFTTKILFFDDGADHQGTMSGRGYLLFVLAVTKFTDMGAYVVGSLIGKNKMVPHLSPGKTWEGFFGAIGFAFLAAFGVTWLFGSEVSLLTPKHTAALALILALGAVAGDLAESTLKRSLAAKDSGHVIPGIGGVLDLIDSILFTGPLFYLYLYLLNR